MVYQQSSKNREKCFFPKTTNEPARFLSHYVLKAKEGEYPLVIYCWSRHYSSNKWL